MYDELVKRLRECTAKQNGEKTLWHQAADAIEDLFAELREEKVDNINLTGQLVEEHAKHLWIPVTERLPEDDNHVLAATQNKRGEYNIVKAYYHHKSGAWAAGMNSNVTHWMPLPEPPKEEI